MVPLELLVVGTGRSGTQRAARLLTKAGFPCGHERVFTPDGYRPPEVPGESSWLAVPHLEHYGPLPRGVVLTYRQPELVVGSFLGIELFTDPRKRHFLDYPLDHVPGLDEALAAGGPMAAAQHWYRWFNLTALAHADLIFRVDDVPIEQLADRCGIDPEALRNADRRIGTVGHHTRVAIDRDDLDPSTIAVWDRLEDHARAEA